MAGTKKMEKFYNHGFFFFQFGEVGGVATTMICLLVYDHQSTYLMKLKK
jgi:hypothetical protein